MKNVKISLFLPSLKGRGGNKVMLNLANGFASRGFSVDLLLAKADGEWLKEVDEQVNIIDFNSSGVLKSIPQFIQYLRNNRPEILLSAMDYVNVLVIIANFLAGKFSKVYVTCHTSLDYSIRNSSRLRDRFLPLLMRFTYPFASQVIAVSEGVANTISDMCEIPRASIQVVYNPVITPDFKQKLDAPIEHPWFQDSETPIVIGLGSLTIQKDFQSLIKAFSFLDKNKRAKLLILGEGELRSELEAIVRELGLNESVMLAGFIHNPLPYLRAARLFVLSSKWEGFGLVVAEALACGTPVVSTNCPSGPAEILENGKYGIL